MTNLKHTKKALLTSLIALVLCFSMLLGTTYAWFTDSATSSGNKIQAGTLDVDLYLWTGADTAVEITSASDPIFGVNSSALAQNDAADTLWEPGKTQTVYLSIKNNGNLDLKYKVAIDVSKATNDLEDFMEYAITPDATYGTRLNWVDGEKVTLGTNATQANNVALKAGEEHFFALSIHMDELATNAQMNGTIEFDIKVLAGQLASELDSLGSDYDKDAVYDGYTEVAAPAAGVSGLEIDVYNTSKNPDVAGSNVGNKDKIGSAAIPADAIDPNAETVTVQIEETKYDLPDNVAIDAGSTKITYNVNIDGLKANNTVPVKVELRIPTGLDEDYIKLYHYGEELTNFTYDHESGMVTFESATFSPFTVTYNLNKTYVAPSIIFNPSAEFEAEIEALAFEGKICVESPELANVVHPWGSYGQWSPDSSVDAAPVLESAYTFTAPHNSETVKNSAFRNWHCDFYLELDRDLNPGEIFLGGNYGSWGWIGFHYNGETIKANNEIGLLESVTTNPWTYEDVVNQVETFICGVADVNDALKGATFTVKLRLTNPENPSNFFDVVTVTYKF